MRLRTLAIRVVIPILLLFVGFFYLWTIRWITYRHPDGTFEVSIPRGSALISETSESVRIGDKCLEMTVTRFDCPLKPEDFRENQVSDEFVARIIKEFENGGDKVLGSKKCRVHDRPALSMRVMEKGERAGSLVLPERTVDTLQVFAKKHSYCLITATNSTYAKSDIDRFTQSLKIFEP